MPCITPCNYWIAQHKESVMKFVNEEKIPLYSELADKIYEWACKDLPISGIIEAAHEINPQLTRGNQEDDFKKVVGAYYNAWIFWIGTSLNTQDEAIGLFNQVIRPWPTEQASSPQKEKKFITQPHTNTAFSDYISYKLAQHLLLTRSQSKSQTLSDQIKPYVHNTLRGAKNFHDVYEAICNGPDNSNRIFGNILANPTPAFQEAAELYKTAVYYYIFNFLMQNQSANDENLSQCFGMVYRYLMDICPNDILRECIVTQGPRSLQGINLFIEKQEAKPVLTLSDGKYTAFHKICEMKGSSELVQQMLSMLEEEEVKAMPRPEEWNPVGLTELLWGRIQQLPKSDPSKAQGLMKDIQKYLEVGASFTQASTSGKTALHYATETGNIEIVKLLLEKCYAEGIELDQFNTNAGSPLHTAILPKHEITEDQKREVVRLWLKQGTDVSQTEIKEGNTALHCAAKHGYPNIIMLLLDEYGAEIDQPNHRGYTPVWLAFKHSQTECITALLERGAATQVPGDSPDPPRSLAKQKEYAQLIKQFEGITTEHQWGKKMKQLSKLRVALAAKNKEIVKLERELSLPSAQLQQQTSAKPISKLPVAETNEKGKAKGGPEITNVRSFWQQLSPPPERKNFLTDEPRPGPS
jgi:ankyrin repeat protein